MDQDSRVLALLAAPTKRVRAWYTSLVGNPLIMVASYSDDLSDLQRKLETMSDVEVLVLDAELFGGPDELRAMLEAFPDVITFVILPPEAGQPEIETVLSMPTVAGGWRGDVKLPEVVGEIRDAVERVRGPLPQPVPASPVASFIPEAPELVAPAPPPAKTSPMEVSSPSSASPPPPGGGRVVAFWSGPSGGTGCTTLALAFSALAASRGIDTILLAFSEPAVSTYLHLDRVPNVESFFTVQKDRLRAAMQRVGWGGQSNRVGMQVILGPARPRDGKITKEQLSLVIEAARAAYPIVVVDVPSLPPGGSSWSMEPLRHATDIVLVMAPILTGISATVEALVTLDELSATGRVHLILNQRFPSGLLGAKDFRAGVESIWHSCPDVKKVGFVQALPDSMNRGEIPDSDILGDGLKALGELAGLPASPIPSDEGRKRFSLGDLGKLRITVQD